MNILKFICYAIWYAGGDFMAINQIEDKMQLENRFPGFHAKESVEHEGLSAFVLSHDHNVQRYPCYNYGYQIGDDITHTFYTQLLIIPIKRLKADNSGAFVIVQIGGYSNYSERYDQDSVSLSCELGNGESMDLESHYDYEKYGGQSRHTKNSLALLLEYMRKKLGFKDLGEQQLANWLSKMRSRFSY